MTVATTRSTLSGSQRQRIRRREPDLHRWAAALAVWYLEHRAGRRSVTQLHAGLTPTLRRRLSQRRATPSPTSVYRVRRCAVREAAGDAREGVVVVDRGRGRCTAVCVRFERHGGSWLAAELTAPEDGERPTVTEKDPYAEVDAFDLIGA